VSSKSLKSGGETGIRTPGTLSRSTVFKTAAFDHSATSPLRSGVSAERAASKSKSGAFLPRVSVPTFHAQFRALYSAENVDAKKAAIRSVFRQAGRLL
jgi:hypothetical protein